MPWLIGLDEAGYGPNCPLLQTAVTVHVAEQDLSLWECSAGVIRRAMQKPDGRLLIDDSKRVPDGAKRAAEAGTGVLDVLASNVLESSQSLEHFLKQILIGNSMDDLGEEEWFERAQPIPLRSNPDELTRMAARLTEAFPFAKSQLPGRYIRCWCLRRDSMRSGRASSQMGHYGGRCDRVLSKAGNPWWRSTDFRGGSTGWSEFLRPHVATGISGWLGSCLARRR